MKTVTRKHIAKEVGERLAIHESDCAAVLNEVLNVISEEVIKGHTLVLRRFGTFSLRDRKGKRWKNPNKEDSEPLQLPDTKKVWFTASKKTTEAAACFHSQPSIS